MDRVGGVADHERRRGDRPGAAATTARPGRRRCRARSPPPTSAAGRGCRARSRPRTARARAGSAGSAPAAPSTVNGRNRAANISGAKATIPASTRVVEHRHLDDQARAPAPGATSATSSDDVGAERRTADRPPGRRRGGRAARRPARRRPSSSRRAGRPGRSERPWPSRSRVTTCSPSAASARASGCVHPARHQLAVQQHHPGGRRRRTRCTPAGRVPTRRRRRTDRCARRPTCGSQPRRRREPGASLERWPGRGKSPRRAACPRHCAA